MQGEGWGIGSTAHSTDVAYYNIQAVADHPESEAQTRARRIDARLEAAGWAVHHGALLTPTAITELATLDGPADYLLYDNEPRAVVEAKKVTKGVAGMLIQAQRYARGIDAPKPYQGEFAVPFAYSTNGVEIWFQDLRDSRNLSRPIKAFHTPTALQELLQASPEQALRWLADTPNLDPGLYDFQQEAIEAIEGAIRKRKRKMLVAMATGTGKTRTTVSLIYRLMRSGLVKRVLFLVDRRALAAQATLAFASYQTPNNRRFSDEYDVYSQRFQYGDIDEEDNFDPKVLPNSYLTDPSGKEAFVYVSTIQRMRINLFGQPDGFYGSDTESEPDAGTLDIPIHAFDLIVADECHRGYTSSEDSKWREVLEHFDGIQVGLTATPASHTTAYFNEIVFRYSYDRAVAEGKLVDYDAIRVQSDFRQNGLFLKEGDEVQLVDATTGQKVFDRLEDERQLAPEQIENNWSSVDSNRKIAREFLKYAREHQAETGRFPKTLFFADNDLPHSSHADQLVRLLREELDEGDGAVVKITGNSDRPLRLIKQFRNRPTPKIAVTVDLLSTGVDIRPLEFIVLIRPLKSRILFEQILGRGTRLCEEIGKTHFTIIDCLGVLEYFRDASAFTDATPDKPTRTIPQIIDDIWNRKDFDYNVKILTKRIQRMAKNITGEGRQRFADFLASCPNLDAEIETFARDLESKLGTHWTEVMGLLRNQAFQEFLTDYPRPQRTIILDEHSIDTVRSEALIGNYKPEDYIGLFEKFIRENPDHLVELDILLNRPHHFCLPDLETLRSKLRATPENFSEDRLKRAYGRPLADVISIIRHAAIGEPILDQAERVDRAIDGIKHRLGGGDLAGIDRQPPEGMQAVAEGQKRITPDQSRWLELIREFLHKNLLISEDDLTLPEFTSRGLTKRKLRDAFGEDLSRLVAMINKNIAA